MIPHLIPVRVSACVMDPAAAVMAWTGKQRTGSKIRQSTFDWAFDEPAYGAALRDFAPLWGDLFEVRRPQALEAPTGDRPAICVSWSVPEGWGRAPDPGGLQGLQVLPDRWLLVRIIRDREAIDSIPLMRAWVVDAGVPVTTGGAPVVENGVAVRVGRVTDIDQSWNADPREKRIPLTVEGAPGSRDLTFAAFAPANIGNLSHIDDLDGIPRSLLERAAVSYMVAGWYRSPTVDDPLSSLKGKSATHIRDRLGLWTPVSDGKSGQKKKTAAPVGERCLFHGMLAHIDYFNPKSYLGPMFGTPSRDRVPLRHGAVETVHSRRTLIGFGATVEEALAELAAPRGDSPTGSDRELWAELFQALLNNTLDQWDDGGPGTAAQRAIRRADRAARAQHATTFQTVTGNRVWRIEPVESGRAMRGTGVPRLPDELQTMLEDLNRLQAVADATLWTITSLSDILYAAFWLHSWRTVVESPPEKVRALGDYQSRRLAELKELDRRHREEMRAVDAVSEQVNGLLTARWEGERSALRAQTKPEDAVVRLCCRLKDGAPFFIPKEPAVAIQNIGPRQPTRPLDVGGRGPDRLATGIRSSAGGEYGAKQASATVPEDIARPIQTSIDADTPDRPLFEALLGLLREGALTEAAIAKMVPDPTFDRQSEAVLWKRRSNDLNGALEGAGVAVDDADGVGSTAIPTILLRAADGSDLRIGDIASLWTCQPWLPVFLDWKVDWTSGAEATTPVELKGRTLLAHRPQRIFAQRLRSLQESPVTLPPDVLKILNAQAGAIGDLDIVGQSLSGIHQQILCRNDACAVIGSADEPLRKFLDLATLSPPELNCNRLLRLSIDGSLRITGLRVVDSFGQAMILENPTVSSRDRSGGTALKLGRRLLEPMRISARPVGCGDGSNPVRGWIVPSLTDRTIAIYDAGGIPLRLLMPARGGGVEQRALSDAAGAFEKEGDPVLEELSGMLSAASNFDQALALIGLALQRTLPVRTEAAGGPAALIGRPLAVMAFDLGIERRGVPVVDPNCLIDQEQLEPLLAPSAKAWPARTGEEIRLRLGSERRIEDGLIGFLTPVAGAAPQLRASAKAGASDGWVTVRLPGEQNSQPLRVTTLVDPLGSVQLDVESGILPTTMIVWPSELCEEVLNRLPAVLPVAPALVASAVELNAVLARAAPPPRIDLPLILGVRGSAAASAKAPARFSISGTLPGTIAIDQTPTLGSIPDGDVAALDGVLIS